MLASWTSSFPERPSLGKGAQDTLLEQASALAASLAWSAARQVHGPRRLLLQLSSRLTESRRSDSGNPDAG